MYIWIGCALPQAFEQDIRRFSLEANREIGADTAGFSLPQHISLKISFDAGSRAEDLCAWLETILSQEHSFYVNPSAIEQNSSILWLTFGENETLSRLHRSLDAALEAQFGIPRHPFDLDFKFHSTLFVDVPEKISRLLPAMEAYPLPQNLAIGQLLLGLSETGAAGSYRVVRRISLI